MNIKEVFKKNPEGFSISYKGMELVEYKTGFSVGVTDNVSNIGDIETTLQNVLITLNNLSINEDLKIVGGWSFEGKYYLDASLWIHNKEDALILAKLFNQKAIWDFKNKDEVKVK